MTPLFTLWDILDAACEMLMECLLVGLSVLQINIIVCFDDDNDDDDDDEDFNN